MNTFQLKDVKTVPDIVHEYSREIRENHIPIIIDNGNCLHDPFTIFAFQFTHEYKFQVLISVESVGPTKRNRT